MVRSVFRKVFHSDSVVSAIAVSGRAPVASSCPAGPPPEVRNHPRGAAPGRVAGANSPAGRTFRGSRAVVPRLHP